MSYKVSLRDRSEIIIPDEAGLKLKEYWLGLTKPTNIEIAGDGYSSSQIVAITKTNLDSQSISERPALSAPRYNCVAANTSIQYLINQVAMKSKDWPKLVQDKAWREKTRLAIRAKYPDRKFCDHVTKEHACLDVKDKAQAA